MLIMLASLSGFPVASPSPMLLVAVLYLGQQVYDVIFVRDNVANFMHIVGGVCRSATKKKKQKEVKQTACKTPEAVLLPVSVRRRNF